VVVQGFGWALCLNCFVETMADGPSISFGDNVRVRLTSLTQQLGLAGLIGNVLGETTPSVTGVEVIGEYPKGQAIRVYFEDRKKGFWFASELLEFIDHAAGAEIRLDGIPKRWSRSATGEWKEIDTARQKWTRMSWWRFWSRRSPV
jgi:hypothetical protein